MIKTSGIDHIALEVIDIANVERFFTELFDMRKVREFLFNNMKIVIIKHGNSIIELIENKEKRNLNDSSLHHIAFRVKNIEIVCELLEKYGLKSARKIYSPIPGLREAVYVGPEEIKIQLVEKDLIRIIYHAAKCKFNRHIGINIEKSKKQPIDS